jgi:predicted ArsR family transcriptional regulator
MTQHQQRVYDTINALEKRNGRYPLQTEIAKELGKERETIRQHLYHLREDGKVQSFKSPKTVKIMRLTFGDNWQTSKELKNYQVMEIRWKTI